MGFGTSGSAILIFTAMFIGLGTVYTATANVSEELNEAGEEQQERHLTVQQTQVTIVAAEWDSTDTNLTVSVNNTGETTLSVEDTDVLVDGEYVPVESFDRREVDGQSTDTWRPDEQLVIEDDETVTDQPDRVKVVTEVAVSDTAEVTVL